MTLESRVVSALLTTHQYLVFVTIAIPMSNLAGKVAVVTGASRGVGRGVARVLDERGATVYVTGRSDEDLRSIGRRVTAIRCDHRVAAEVVAAFRRILVEKEGIQLLINNVCHGDEISVV